MVYLPNKSSKRLSVCRFVKQWLPPKKRAVFSFVGFHEHGTLSSLDGKLFCNDPREECPKFMCRSSFAVFQSNVDDFVGVDALTSGRKALCGAV